MVSFKSLGNFSLSNSLCLVEDTVLTVTLRHLSPTSFSSLSFWGGRAKHIYIREWRLRIKIMNLASGASNSFNTSATLQHPLRFWLEGPFDLFVGFYELPGRMNPLKMLTISIWLSFNKESKPLGTSKWAQTQHPSVTHGGSHTKCHFLPAVPSAGMASSLLSTVIFRYI